MLILFPSNQQVGLMREGRLLAEESPETLITLFRCDTLEDVFLILCKQQEEGHLRELEYLADDQRNGGLQNAESASSMAMSEIGHGSLDVSFPLYRISFSSIDDDSKFQMLTKRPPKKRNKSVGTFSLNRNHLKALMGKNWLQYFKNTA